MTRRIGVAVLAALATLGLSACAAKTTGTTGVTDGSATLHASASCDAGQRCSWYWQYWPASGPRSEAATTPVAGPVNGPVSASDLTTTITGLPPGTAFRWVFCASPGGGAGYACVGPHGSFEDTTADPPADYDTFTTAPERTLAEQSISGGAWTVQSTPNPAGASSSALRGISCRTAQVVKAPHAACSTVGDYLDGGVTFGGALAEVFHGTDWTSQTLPSPTQGPLNAVACSPPGPLACTAVGEVLHTASPLIDRLQDKAWSQQTPDPPGGYSSVFTGVSCPTATACLAVGVLHPTPMVATPLAEVWNGSDWTQDSPAAGGAQGFSAVSCVSATACTAVGGEPPGADAWNGSSWTAETVPLPSGASSLEVDLTGVSCTSSDACTAVGSYPGGSGRLALVERWDGTSWTIEPTPDPPVGSSDQLNAVSCTASTSCTAVGVRDSGVQSTLIETWNGTAWTVVPSPSPAGTVYDVLDGVSCLRAPASVCEAVGSQ